MKNQHLTAYFYLPASDERPSEIIQILNANELLIQVPMREEDVVLESFFQREMTEAEIGKYGRQEVWQIFGSWSELIEDHFKLQVSEYVLSQLSHFKRQFYLPEGMAA